MHCWISLAEPLLMAVSLGHDQRSAALLSFNHTSSHAIVQVHALRNLGYTFLYAYSLDRAVQLYQLFPELVTAVLVESDESQACWDNTEYCLLSDWNPDGIPAWKIFSFYFWTNPANPLGQNWTLSPEEVRLRSLLNNRASHDL